MPRTLGGLLGFVIMATVTVVVGTFVYNRFLAPVVGNLLQKAA